MASRKMNEARRFILERMELGWKATVDAGDPRCLLVSPEGTSLVMHTNVVLALAARGLIAAAGTHCGTTTYVIATPDTSAGA